MQLFSSSACVEKEETDVFFFSIRSDIPVQLLVFPFPLEQGHTLDCVKRVLASKKKKKKKRYSIHSLRAQRNKQQKKKHDTDIKTLTNTKKKKRLKQTTARLCATKKDARTLFSFFGLFFFYMSIHLAQLSEYCQPPLEKKKEKKNTVCCGLLRSDALPLFLHTTVALRNLPNVLDRRKLKKKSYERITILGASPPFSLKKKKPKMEKNEKKKEAHLVFSRLPTVIV